MSEQECRWHQTQKTVFSMEEEQPKRISISGPIENVDGRMMLQIPLEAGGSDLAPSAKDIGRIEDGLLKVEIPSWLAEKLNIDAESFVTVDNLEGQFRITRVGKEPERPSRATP
jgi:hypothetical protein